MVKQDVNEVNLLNDEQKIFIKIDYDEQVEAEYLSNYISSLNKELKYFLKSQKLNAQYSDKLFIKKIEAGSIEIFPNLELLYGATIPFLPQMNAAPILFEFVKTVVKNLELFKLPDNVNLSHNRLGFYLNMNLFSNNTKSITYNYYSENNEVKCIEQPKGQDALLIEQNLKEKLKEKDKLTCGEKFESVPFYWDNAKFKSTEQFNFKGSVDSIIKKPLFTFWQNDKDKKYMTEESHLGKPWQELNYIVDLEIQQVKDNFCYKILNVHEAQTFYIED